MHDLKPFAATSMEQSDELLDKDEVILIVDDFVEIVELLQEFLVSEGFAVISARTASGLHEAFENHNIALVLLDIGLPDADGQELLPQLKSKFADTSIIMLTAVNDLQTALSCMRLGADDYLTKPVHFADLVATLRKVLEKRRLKINNREYQRRLEQAQFRLQLTHELAMKMNTAFLSLVELDEILQAILVGITAEEGLQFNRAFLALFNDNGDTLDGRMAIGPDNREDGGRIWNNLRELDLGLHDLITKSDVLVSDAEVNRIVKALQVKTTDEEHILMKAVHTRRPINVVNGECEYPVPVELLGLLQEESFVVVPLFSSNRSLGVIIADHFISGSPITEDRIHALESFASQASLAIEHCRLYMNMEQKIKELEAMTRELEKNKDLLVEAERYSSIGHVAAQLAHNIRNPITSIGGTARLLSRKTDNPDWLQFLNMMTMEAEKIEGTLEDLLSFVEEVKPDFEQVPLFQVIEKSLLLHAAAFKEHGITQRVELPVEEPVLTIDPRLIQQVLVHLIRNSIEAMAGGGELTVQVHSVGNEIVITIIDTGVGIAEANLDRVSDPFFTTKTFGTGMGLTLVKRIVEDHRGSLRVEAHENGGTKAVVVLPLL